MGTKQVNNFYHRTPETETEKYYFQQGFDSFSFNEVPPYPYADTAADMWRNQGWIAAANANNDAKQYTGWR